MKAIAAALAKAQAEMGKALKESTNPAFRSKYADLGNVMDACLPALNKHGIAVIQPFFTDDMGGRFVKTVFIHESGETIECAIPLILGKNDMQGLGSALTYARRYGLMAMAGIAPEDDDGNAAANTVKDKNPTTQDLARTIYDAARDALPANATPDEHAEAIADAICQDFAGKKIKALENAWNKHQPMIDRIAAKYEVLHERIVDAYETRKNELTEPNIAAE